MTDISTETTITTPAERTRGIIEEVATRHGLTYDDLFRKTHKFTIAHARQEAWARLRALKPALSYPFIGTLFSCHHTTVLYGVEAHHARVAKYRAQYADQAVPAP